MSPAWARRFYIGITAAAGFGGMALVCAPDLERFAASAQAAVKADPVATQGPPPGGAFFIDLREGLDVKTTYLSDFDFSADWISMSFKKANIVFGADGMKLLALRTPGEEARYTSSEFQRKGFYGYGRYEVVMQSSAAEGVVSSFFTHTDGQFGAPHSEIDFEFIGRSPGDVHLNYYVSGKDNPSNVALWFDPSKAEHLYAFDWGPGFIAWYVDGLKVREVSKESSPIGIPAYSSRVIANTWTGNGTAGVWVGVPAFEWSSALYRCISHVPAGGTGRQCSDEFAPTTR